MAVYKEEKTNTWRAVYRYTDWNGERKQTQKRGFKTKREAQAWEREQLNKTSADLDMTFRSFVDLYTADMKTRLKPDYLLYAYYPDRCIRLWVLHVPEGLEQETSILVDNAQDTSSAQSAHVMLLDSESQITAISAAVPCILAYPDQTGRLHLKNWEGN